MKIVISSFWYPVGVAVYLERAARRAGHEVVRAGPTSGSFTGWLDAGDKKDQPDFAVAVDLDVTDKQQPRDVDAWVAAMTSCDLWIDVDGGWFASARIPTRRRVLVATDPHCEGEWWSYRRQRPFVRETYVMQSPYALPGDKWLPYGYDPPWHFPEKVEQTYDVTNIGAPYMERIAISEELKKRGLRVLGPGRGALGDAYRRALCSAPIAIVWPMKDDLPARVFEARAMGRVVLTRDVPDLVKTDASSFCVRVNEFDVARICDLAAGLRFRGYCDHEPPGGWWRHSWDVRLAQLIEWREKP